MADTKSAIPAVEGWFTTEPSPTLLGSRCPACGTFSFPRETLFCRNPECEGQDFEDVSLSRRGRIWSYTDARYQPPLPYRAADPYEPFCIAAVELAAEKMVVMGQVVPGVGVDDLSIGTEVELVTDLLYEDDDHRYLVWKWRPVAPGDTAGDGHG
jgi:uncharacterized OB-fold protein